MCFKKVLVLFLITAVTSGLLTPLNIYAKNDSSQGTILIVASYNPDTKRMSDFISEFEKEINKSNVHFNVLIEDMGCKSIADAPQWTAKVHSILKKYKVGELKAVVFLGQEAWAAFLTQSQLFENVPFFSCFASENGIIIPTNTDDMNLNTWAPESVDMLALALRKGMGGGYLNRYDVDKNIELIRSFYPETENIAFVSDNTYGGISLQAHVKKQMLNYPELNLILIDSRVHGLQAASEFVAQLPKKTVLLIGTWRVDKNGLYFLNSSIESLVIYNPKIPVFSISGSGIGTIAIGGYIPKYESNGAQIANQIKNLYANKSDSVFFYNEIGGVYQFDKQKINEIGIKEYQLPKNSVFVNDMELKLRQYQYYIYMGSIVLLFLILFSVFLYFLYVKNKRLREILESNKSELIIAKEKAEESDRLKSSFLANMSHEIRTPLNAIVGFSTLLSDSSSSEESRNSYVDIISKNSELLITLINDVLDISRLESGKTPFVYNMEDVYVVCEQVVSTTFHLRKPGIEYVYKPSCESFMIETDVHRLSQVLINFITNANKFTDSGHITLAFDVDTENNCVVFSVTDTGCGISSEMQKKVFNRFEKLDEYKQGTGLGLAICKQIVFRLGGEIWIDSNYTGGCRFVFSHPIKSNRIDA